MTNDEGHPAPTDSIERTVLLDADAARVIEALTSPELLTAWLGEWSPGNRERDGGDETVVTDDGHTRVVHRIDTSLPGEIAWRWRLADAPDSWSDVRFTVTTRGNRTELTVLESRPKIDDAFATRGTPRATAGTPGAPAAPTAPAVSWLGCLMALGAVLAVGSLVAV